MRANLAEQRADVFEPKAILASIPGRTVAAVIGRPNEREREIRGVFECKPEEALRRKGCRYPGRIRSGSDTHASASV